MVNDTVRVPLTKHKSTIIDAQDAALLIQYRWYASLETGVWYAKKNATQESQVRAMHRLILNAPPGMDVDHINGDGLDNRRSNLRLATRAQNNANNRRTSTSGLKGVRWNEQCQGWVAEANGAYVGVYATAEYAALAHDIAAIKAFGEYARTNYPREDVLGMDAPPNKKGRTHWTKAEDAVLFSGKQICEVAEEVGRSMVACRLRRDRLNREGLVAISGQVVERY